MQLRTRGALLPVVLALLVGACGGSSTVPADTQPAAVVTTAPAIAPPASATSTATSRPADTTEPATTAVAPTTPTTTTVPPPVTARVVLVGDVMLGRGVASRVRDDPEAVFADVAGILGSADVAALNLESPLTIRPHIAINDNVLKADPGSAAVLAMAGFDLAVVANNHATDSGRSTVLDTIAALADADLESVGGGPDRAAAFAPLMVEHDGLRIAFVAFDVTLAAWPATPDRPGVAHWDPALAEPAVRAARDQADIVVVSIHGGVEYRTGTDRRMADIAEQLAVWGADVVWGHGPHVPQPIYVIEVPSGRDVVVATSLGNYLFDMRAAGTQGGPMLEIEVDGAGVVAYRVGETEHSERRVVFTGWQVTTGTDDAGWARLRR